MRKDSECVFLKGQYFTVSCKKLSYVKECRFHGVRSGLDGCLKKSSLNICETLQMEIAIAYMVW